MNYQNALLNNFFEESTPAAVTAIEVTITGLSILSGGGAALKAGVKEFAKGYGQDQINQMIGTFVAGRTVKNDTDSEFSSYYPNDTERTQTNVGAGGLAAAVLTGGLLKFIKDNKDKLNTKQSNNSQADADAVSDDQYSQGLEANRDRNTTTEGGESPDRDFASPEGDLAVGQVDCYSNTCATGRGTVGDGLTGDHMPSSASTQRAFENELGFELTPKQASRLHNNGGCVVVRGACHISDSRTYGGRNSSNQIDLDASDLKAAADADFDTMIPSIRHEYPDITDSELDNIRKNLHEHNRANIERFNDELGTTVRYGNATPSGN